MRALVSMSFSPTSVYVVRRLRALGCRVTAVDSVYKSYASCSRAVDRSIIAPSLRDDPAGFADFILQELRTEQYDLFVPVFECGFLMARYADEIKSLCRMVTMPFEDIMRVRDKAVLQDISRQAGVPVIESTHAPLSLTEAEQICRETVQASVIKGRFNCNAHGQRIVFEPSGLYETYLDVVSQMDPSDGLPLIQPYIRGHLVSSINLAQDGRKIGGAVFKALRTVPVAGGTSCYRETIDSPACEQYDEQLIRLLGWTGFICFDYMADEKTGQLHLIDCNPRMAPGLALAGHAGVDLMRACLDIAAGRQTDPLPRARAGVRSKLQFLDANWMLANLSDAALTTREKWQCFRQWSRLEACHGDLADWRDMRPVIELYRYLLANLRELRGPKGGELFYRHALFSDRRLAEQLQADRS